MFEDQDGPKVRVQYDPEKIVAMEVYWLRGQTPRSMQKDVSPQP